MGLLYQYVTKTDIFNIFILKQFIYNERWFFLLDSYLNYKWLDQSVFMHDVLKYIPKKKSTEVIALVLFILEVFKYSVRKLQLKCYMLVFTQALNIYSCHQKEHVRMQICDAMVVGIKPSLYYRAGRFRLIWCLTEYVCKTTTYMSITYRSGVKVSSVWMTVSGGMSSSLSVFQSALSSERM